MSRENSGPPHAQGCLGAMRVSESPTGHGHCACERVTWLGELVPRARARAEVLNQLARWAHEQGVFAEGEVSKPELDSDAPRASWRQDALRMGGRLAREVYISVRMTALSLAKECARLEQPAPASTSAPDLLAGVDAAVVAPEVRALLHPDFGDAAIEALRAALVAQFRPAVVSVPAGTPHRAETVATAGDRL